jgi:hypothetical protein
MFKIKQDNYTKKPTAQQRKVILFVGCIVPATRIEAHLLLAGLKQTPEGKVRLQAWRAAEITRKAQAQGGANAAVQPADNIQR